MKMKKANEDIRAAARKERVFLYQIADELCISEPTFNRWLRRELSEKQKTEVYAAIALIAERNQDRNIDIE